MKTLKIFCLVLLVLLLSNCGRMDENYKDYLTNVPVYSPRVTNLTVVSGLKEATLSWKNPQGKIAIKNVIKLQDSIIVMNGLAETYKLTNLEIKGYLVSVYTQDTFSNYSVPTSIYIFPNGE
ncbi:MAG TPA: DUF4998 domain-containing protein [Bacteroidales bacterium]|nr:DUF4998 domain-containing protein [Bacteroidales bacterium]